MDTPGSQTADPAAVARTLPDDLAVVDPQATEPETGESEAAASADPALYNADQVATIFTTTRRTVLKWREDSRRPAPLKFG
jgi:hypothetical protein